MNARVNTNRKPYIYGRGQELHLEDQVQRLQTYNTLLRDTLTELHEAHHYEVYFQKALQAKVRKVIGL